MKVGKRVVVIGGGIAGVAAAAHLADAARVWLLEKEGTLAYHTTGRSAALFIVNYGAEGSRPLARASQHFLENPPEGSTDYPLLTERGALWVANPSQLAVLESIAREGRESGADTRWLDASDVLELVPVLHPDKTAAGLYEPTGMDIDVAALHQTFVRIARKGGAVVQTNAEVLSLDRSGDRWIVTTAGERLECDAVVNASGAWGDQIAELAGIDPVGLQPMRRTAFMVPGREEYSRYPMVVDAEQRFYFKPDGTQILCSLAEEVRDAPGDPRPRTEDVALAIERINETTTLGIRTVNSEWTGLRTFAPDRDLVIGEEPMAPGFFWLVGQGGTGIATAPAYGALVASQVLERNPPQDLVDAGVDPSLTLPDRFRV